jgi:aspartate carbamoyltransferase catalytic subunit
MNHLISLKNMNVTEILAILSDAIRLKNGEVYRFDKPIYMTNLFYEPSTRTKISFELAQRKLGINIINFDINSSSIQKGETLYDTVKTIESMEIDGVVIRHPEDQYYKELVDKCNISIFNAGDGCGEHPSQTLLDLLTIKEEFGDFNNLTISIIGDISHSRVAKSNAEILSRLGVKLYFAGPKEWFSDLCGLGTYIDIDRAVEISDVVMLLRVQHERHNTEQKFDIDRYHRTYGLTIEREKRMKNNCIIMHPAPVNRGVEIDTDLVECKRSRIFDQVNNGVFVRMAAIKYILQQRYGGNFVETSNKKWQAFVG